MKDKLNVKVGDPVYVIFSENAYFISVVTKVFPNGRFLIKGCDDYWRADGTKNTHALKNEKNYRVAKIGESNFDDLARCYISLTVERLKNIADRLDGNDRKAIDCLDDIKYLNRFLDYLGLKRQDYFKLKESEV